MPRGVIAPRAIALMAVLASHDGDRHRHPQDNADRSRPATATVD